jgi:chlorobactene glucosyltransferase
VLSGFDLGLNLGLDVWVALGVAVLLTGFLIVSRWHYTSLPKLPPPSPDQSIPDCMVIIPARNEEFFIGRAVKSLPHDTVIVVDDHSEDATAQVARKNGAGVMRAPELPQGAIGKANACLAGARALASKWILFTDADTWFEPGFLNAAVACAEASGLTFLSIYPRIECETWPEAILVPYAAALFFCGVSPSADPTAVFNGQCMLVRRDAYEFIGAHAAVMNTMIDDVKLSGLARRHRLKFASVRAEGLAHVRLREPSAAFRRGAFRFMSVSSWMGITIIAAGTLAALWLPLFASLLWNGEEIAAALFGVLPVVITLPWYRNPLRALLAPIAIYGMLPILYGGMISALSGSGVEWKGRVV